MVYDHDLFCVINRFLVKDIQQKSQKGIKPKKKHVRIVNVNFFVCKKFGRVRKIILTRCIGCLCNVKTTAYIIPYC